MKRLIKFLLMALVIFLLSCSKTDTSQPSAQDSVAMGMQADTATHIVKHSRHHRSHVTADSVKLTMDTVKKTAHQIHEVLQLTLNLTHSHLRPTSIVVFRHEGGDKLPLPNLEPIDVREYGDMMIELLRPIAAEKDADSTL